MSIPEGYRIAETCPECYGAGLVDHPAWVEVYKRHVNPDKLHDWQIALAMTVGGCGDDVTVTLRDAEGRPMRYAFPDRMILCDCLEPVPTREFVRASFDEWAKGVAAGVLKVEESCSTGG